MEEDQKTLKDYLRIVRRRKFIIVISALILALVSVTVAVILPPVFESQATILIEQQHIPSELVKSTVTSYGDERVKQIEQQVMTIDNIMRIINKFGLYAEQKEKLNVSELTELFRTNTILELLNADVISNGKSSKATLAFNLSFDDKDPVMAQKVTTELVSLFLNENIQNRTKRAQETTHFLEEEAEKYKLEIQKDENKLAEYKEKFSNSLPELLPANLTMISRIETELQQLFMQEKLLDERKASLNSQLATASQTNAPGHAPISLDELKLEKSRLLSKYSATHPDILQLERQIDQLEKESSGKQGESQDLLEARRELMRMRQLYSDSHPDVKTAQRKLAELESTNKSQSAGKQAAENASGNLVYFQLKSGIDLAEQEQANIRSQRIDMQKKLRKLEEYVSITHQVERGYYELVRDLDNIKAKYSELKAKQMEAKLAQTLEDEQMAERFTLLEPPQIPDKPIKPERLKILFVGFIVTIGGGLGAGWLAEMLDGSIRSYQVLKAITGMEPLIVIPYIQNQDDKNRIRKIMMNSYVMAVLLSIGIIIAVYFY